MAIGFKDHSHSLLHSVPDCPLKKGLQVEQLLLQYNKCVLDDLVGVLVTGLYLHFNQVLQRMGLPVACKLDLLIFEQIYSEQISNGVVLEGNAVCSRVDHLLALDDFDEVLGLSLFVLSADFEPVVLVHLYIISKLAVNLTIKSYGNDHLLSTYKI